MTCLASDFLTIALCSDNNSLYVCLFEYKFLFFESNLIFPLMEI